MIIISYVTWQMFGDGLRAVIKCNMKDNVTSAKEVMFLSALLCSFVSRITENLLN